MKPIINNETNILDNDYLLWIQDLCNRYRQSQIKASLQVNKGILSFYWELGKDIENVDMIINTDLIFMKN